VIAMHCLGQQGKSEFLVDKGQVFKFKKKSDTKAKYYVWFPQNFVSSQ
jgi:hypothetical protein